MSSIRFRMFAAALGLGIVQAGMAAGASAPGAQAELVVGLRYVAPPFVGGNKVRTLESIETGLVQDIAKRLDRRPRYIELDASASSVPAGEVDFAVVDLPQGSKHLQGGGVIAIATGQVTRPMAIMRTDTDIKSWGQLKGRTVCVSEDGRYVGRIAAEYGAVEQIYRAPADSLLALRTGKCDAAVHDDVMLKALLRFPEWKKFSASLPPGEAAVQYFLVPPGNPDTAALLKEMVGQWKAQSHHKKRMKAMTQDIAFEVYLDQTVPDCH